jgi:hypothetical protein
VLATPGTQLSPLPARRRGAVCDACHAGTWSQLEDLDRDARLTRVSDLDWSENGVDWRDATHDEEMARNWLRNRRLGIEHARQHPRPPGFYALDADARFKLLTNQGLADGYDLDLDARVLELLQQDLDPERGWGLVLTLLQLSQDSTDRVIVMDAMLTFVRNHRDAFYDRIVGRLASEPFYQLFLDRLRRGWPDPEHLPSTPPRRPPDGDDVETGNVATAPYTEGTIEIMGVDGDGKAFFGMQTPSLAAWPASMELPSGYFACLVVADGTAETTEELGTWAKKAIEQGLVYPCSWGPSCEVVEDAVDWAALEMPDAESRPVIAPPLTKANLSKMLLTSSCDWRTETNFMRLSVHPGCWLRLVTRARVPVLALWSNPRFASNRPKVTPVIIF